MILKKSTKILIGAAAAIGLYKGVNLLSKVSKLADNISVSATPKSFSLASVTTVKAVFAASLNNYSGFNLSIKNLLSKLYLVTSDGAKIEAGVSNRVGALDFKDGEVKIFDLNFNFSYLTLVGKILGGKIKSIELVTYYDFKGQTLHYTTVIDYAAFAAKAKSFVTGNKTVSGVGNIGML